MRQDSQRDRSDDEARTNPGYALGQIAKALKTASDHDDAATRARALERISTWESVLAGMLTGTTNVGSRFPLSDTPPWVTLEVVTGGFVTGGKLASGPLLEHERQLLARLSAPHEDDARRRINGHYLTDEGLVEIQRLLDTGRFVIEVPEEGALLVVAWLVRNGHVEEARSLIEEIGPHFGSLRFYPVPSENARGSSSRAFLQDVAATARKIQEIGPNSHILAQNEAINVWSPFHDRVVGLFLETVEGEPPHFNSASDLTATTRGHLIQGGWPCQHYPEDWHERAQAVIREYETLRRTHKLCGKPERSGAHSSNLRGLLRQCLTGPDSLSGRDVGKIRLILACYVTKRGTPDSVKCRDSRTRQAVQASFPTFHDISKVLPARLEVYPSDDGMDNPGDILYPVTDDEGVRWKIEPGTPIPQPLERKVRRCHADIVDVLVEEGLISSGETLANVLPQMTAGVRSAGIVDPSLRRIYAEVYQAFRRRRSLLLLNLQSQVKIEELPWIAAIERYRTESTSSRQSARRTLVEVSSLVIRSFPSAIVPNKLVRELRALAKGAQIDLPLVEELAADIFMGEFSGQFVKAATTAADLLEGSLYQNYYGIDFQRIRHLPEEPEARRWWTVRRPRSSLLDICVERSGVSYDGWMSSNPTINGMIIEQQQILTTQNLATLYDGLNLGPILHGLLPELAKRCFEWVCKRQQVKNDEWHAKLIMLKNCAYAWRQMVFFLSLVSPTEVVEFLDWARSHLDDQHEGFAIRFEPAFRGLEVAAHGVNLSVAGARPDGATQFLGWTKGKHWLLD